jgi:hypothetical protein
MAIYVMFLWFMTLYYSLRVKCFGGIYCLHPPKLRY